MFEFLLRFLATWSKSCGSTGSSSAEIFHDSEIGCLTTCITDYENRQRYRSGIVDFTLQNLGTVFNISVDCGLQCMGDMKFEAFVLK